VTGATVRQCVVRLDDPTMASLVVGGRSCLGWLLREFSRFGVGDVLLLGDGGTDVTSGLPRPVRVGVSPVLVGSGSGGALWQVRDRLRERFLVCDGGAVFDWNLARLLADGVRDGPEVIGRVVTGGRIGLFRKDVVAHLRPVCSLGADVLPDLAERGLLRVTGLDREADAGADLGAMGSAPVVSWPALGRTPTTSTHSPQQDMGGRPRAGHDTISADDGAFRGFRRKALLLDRDGVLNIDHGYVGSRDRFDWVDGALEAIRYATEAGWHVFVVTNQSGVARGLYSEDAVRDLLDWMAGEARAAGGTIDDVRFCPFHPDAAVDAYRQAHPWRKPLPGMLLDLIRTWELDPRHAMMIGDQETDMRAAAAAGVAGHLFRGGNLLAFLRPILDRQG
jgi:D-glycero-D-manno-heptose 1,7-bisphosphate phosphatase